MPKPKYAYSSDEEYYSGSCDSVGEAFIEYVESNMDKIVVGDSVSVGEIHDVTIQELMPDYAWLIEYIEEGAYEMVGDVCDGQLGKKIEDKEGEIIMGEISEILIKHGVKPSFFRCENVRAVKITKEDMGDE